jgi:hypothetical protein
VELVVMEILPTKGMSQSTVVLTENSKPQASCQLVVSDLVNV